jgi:hypothetical protein
MSEQKDPMSIPGVSHSLFDQLADGADGCYGLNVVFGSHRAEVIVMEAGSSPTFILRIADLSAAEVTRQIETLLGGTLVVEEEAGEEEQEEVAEEQVEEETEPEPEEETEPEPEEETEPEDNTSININADEVRGAASLDEVVRMLFALRPDADDDKMLNWIDQIKQARLTKVLNRKGKKKLLAAIEEVRNPQKSTLILS